METTTAIPTLYEWIGGIDALNRPTTRASMSTYSPTRCWELYSPE
jgi:hypothetical protein